MEINRFSRGSTEEGRVISVQLSNSGRSFPVKVMLELIWGRKGILYRQDTVIKGTMVRNNRICEKNQKEA